MTKRILLVIGCLVLLTGVAVSQEVVIKDFPIGVAGSIGQDIFKPHHDDLKAGSHLLPQLIQGLRKQGSAVPIHQDC